jgi:transposase
LGIKNLVIDPASIDTKRRARNAKTDRIDAEKLLSCLIRYLNGEKRTFAVVHVPSAEEEDIRRVNREIKRLQKERTSHTNRIKSLLVLCGIIQEIGIGFLNDLELLRQWDGNPVPPNIKSEIIREYRRYELVKKHVEELEGKKKEILKSLGNGADKALRLEQLKGVGPVSAWLMTFEFFGWREFKNVKQVGAAAGLTPTPHNSGDMVREQGISKSGNKRIRATMIELSWLWLRYQPESRITIWFNERFATAGKRMRRIGIVAVARKLLVALWKYLEKGMIPEGSILKANA